MRNWSKNKAKKWKISKHCYNIQQQPLYFDILSYNMSSIGIKLYMDGFYTSRSFQRHQDRMIQSLDEEVMKEGVRDTKSGNIDEA